jgi:hypothetical protein
MKPPSRKMKRDQFDRSAPVPGRSNVKLPATRTTPRPPCRNRVFTCERIGGHNSDFWPKPTRFFTPSNWNGISGSSLAIWTSEATKDTQHPTSNIEHPVLQACEDHWTWVVRCWALDVHSVSGWRTGAPRAETPAYAPVSGQAAALIFAAAISLTSLVV